MSVMRITIIVHSVDGDDDRYQDACMASYDLPDSMDRETAVQLMGGLGGHIDDELKRIDEQEGRSVMLSTKGEGWPG